MTGWVADYSASRPGGAALKAAGCTGVVRYAGALISSFNISTTEIADLADHDLPVAIVCEQRTDDILGGRAVGAQMARAALEDTRAAGLPDGLVYAACDLDATKGGPTSPGSPGDRQMAQVHETLIGFADVLGWPNVGFYGSYYAIDWLIAKAVPVAAYWSTVEAWSDGKRHPRAALYQRATAPITVGAGIDFNEVNGDWRPRTSTPTPTPTGGRVHAVTGDLENLHPTLLARLQAMADGEGTDIHVNSGHRSHAKQIDLWNAYQHYLAHGSPWAALAARPGTSLHEGNGPAYALGIAADISIPGYEYARTKLGGHVAARYGLVDAIPTEGWHFQGVEGRGLPAAPQPDIHKEDDVAIPLPRLDLAREKGHPESVALFSDLVKRVNPAADVSSPAARAQTCKNLQAFFKIAGGADGVVGANTWGSLLYLATKGGK